MSKVVLDASAVLAVLQLEPGGEKVADRLAHAHISAVNLAEVVSKLIDKGHTLEMARRIVGILSMTIEEVDEAQAYQAAAMRSPTRKSGLSIGDRFCLALAGRMGVPAVTTDRSWASIDLGIEVIVARNGS